MCLLSMQALVKALPYMLADEVELRKPKQHQRFFKALHRHLIRAMNRRPEQQSTEVLLHHMLDELEADVHNHDVTTEDWAKFSHLVKTASGLTEAAKVVDTSSPFLKALFPYMIPKG